MNTRSLDITDTAFAVVLEHGLGERIETFARRGYPDEVCGLLIGRFDGIVTRVDAVLEAANRASISARRYILDPDDFLAAEWRARETGLEVVGVWHSHPDHPPRPSATDLEHAWPGYSYVIVAVTKDGLPEIRSWRLHDDRFIEERLQS